MKNLKDFNLKSLPLNSFLFKEKEYKGKFDIQQTSVRRISPKIDEYLQAVEGAKSKLVQNRILLYDHYDRTLDLDTFASSLLEKRLENITNKKIVLFKEDEPVDEINYFFKCPQFKSFLKDIIMTKFWGMNLFEFNQLPDKDDENKLWFDYKIIPHKHINPYNKHVLKRQHDSEGVSWKDEDDILFIGNENELGYLLKITLLSLYRRYGMFAYSNYLDLASENFQTIKARGIGDEEAWQRVQEELLEKGAGGTLQVPEGTKVTSENNASGQQNQLFENYMKMLKEEMAILILGQTMTTQDGASYSQAFVHEEQQEEKYSSDEQYILDVLNYDFIDYLPLWNFDIDQTYEFRLVPTSDQETNLKLSNYKKLKELGYEFTNEELKEAFGDII